MKKVSYFLIITIISIMSSQVFADRFWWTSGVSKNTNEFMSIYFEENLPLWETSRSRIDGLSLRRESAVVLNRERNANTPEWQAMAAFVPTWDITFAMNSGASNKSWEKEPSGAADTQRRGDLAALENLTAAGAKHVTMFLQSPMSKGGKATFIDGPNGASIATRIEDVKRYINWIEARKPEGVLVDYALIDAHPAKGIFPDPVDYQDVYRQLATALRDAGMPFVGIMFDWKASTISRAGARELIDICKWVQTDLSQELGVDYYAGWWIWYFVKGVPQPTLYQRGLRGVGYVMDEPDNHWISHVYIGAALGNPPMLPDTVNGFPVGRLEGINENYELMEPKIADNLSIELQGTDSILLNWEVGVSEELGLAVQRKTADTEFADIAQLTTLDTTYLDSEVVRGETYTYRIYAPDAGAGREYSNEAGLRVPDIMVEYRNQSSDPQSNTIMPQLRLNNTGGFEYSYEDLSIRYWFTAENHNDLVFTTDWAAIGAQNVAADYMVADPVRVGGNYYAEIGFAASAGSLASNANSGEIHNRIYKVDWTPFDETNDYSHGNNTSYAVVENVTLYLNGELIWGQEPELYADPKSELVVHQKNASADATSNTIHPMLNVENVGQLAVPYSQLSLRYWLSSEDETGMAINSWIDWADIGASNVTGQVSDTIIGTVDHDKYFEVGFNLESDLAPLSSSGEIHARIAKSDWSNFAQVNDHSYIPSGGWTQGANVTAYVDGQLVWGTEPEIVAIRAPFTDDGLPWSVGEIIQAEDFDTTLNGVSGQGVNYFEADTKGGDITLRPDELVDVFSKVDINGDPVVNIGAIPEGEWWAYTIEIPAAGNYSITFRSASLSGTKQFTFYLGEEEAVSITFPATGNWKNFQVFETDTFSVAEPGVYQLVMFSNSGGNDPDWLRVNTQP